MIAVLRFCSRFVACAAVFFCASCGKSDSTPASAAAANPAGSTASDVPSPSSLSDLTGQWFGHIGNQTEAVYTFRDDGTMSFSVSDSQSRNLYPTGLPCKYELKPASPYWNLDIRCDVGDGFTAKAIYQRISPDEFKIEMPQGNQTDRPTAFDASAIAFTRITNPPPDKRISPRHRHTFTTYADQAGNTFLSIHPDGTVSIKRANYDLQTIPYLAGAIDLIPNSRVVGTDNGSWFFLGTTTRQIVRMPQYDIAQIAQAADQDNGFLTTAGNVYTESVNILVPPRPDALLDNIVSISGQDVGNRTSHRCVMLRSDGTVWTTSGKPESFGWVTTNNSDTGALLIHGLSHVKDISVYSMTNFDTGVALKEDGSVVHWGDSDPTFLGGGQNPPLDSPTLKMLPNPQRVAKIAAGPQVIGFIDQQGKVWVFGGGGLVKLLDGGADSPAVATDAVEVPGIENAVDLQLTEGLGMALCRDGTLWSWTDSTPPKKVMDNVRLPGMPIPPRQNPVEAPNPLIGKWTCRGDEKLWDSCEVTQTQLIPSYGQPLAVTYRIEANTVTINISGNSPFICTFQNPNYATVDVGFPGQNPSAEFDIVREPSPQK